MIVGITVFPVRLTRIAPAGTFTSAARPTCVMRAPSTTIVALSIGARPSPTMTRAPSKAVTVGDCARFERGHKDATSSALSVFFMGLSIERGH
jgi:hypothetical protein